MSDPAHASGYTLILSAAHFAAAKHRDQRRKGAEASPYINHPVAVARLLAEVGGVEDPRVLAAALLHDTVEDTDTTPRELEERFGRVIRSLVEEVTDDKSLPKEERKRLQIEHTPHLSGDAKAIKLADKTCNVRDVTRAPPADWSPDRRRRYLDWAERVVEGCRDVNTELEELFDASVDLGRQALELEGD